MLNLGLRRAFRSIFLVADVRRAVIRADFLHNYGLLVSRTPSHRLRDPAIRSRRPIIRHIAPISAMLDEPFATLLREFPTLTRLPDWTQPVQHCAITSSPPAHQSISDPGVCPRINSRSLARSSNTSCNLASSTLPLVIGHHHFTCCLRRWETGAHAVITGH